MAWHYLTFYFLINYLLYFIIKTILDTGQAHRNVIFTCGIKQMSRTEKLMSRSVWLEALHKTKLAVDILLTRSDSEYPQLRSYTAMNGIVYAKGKDTERILFSSKL